MLEGFVDFLVKGLLPLPSSSIQTVEQLCVQCGWGIKERESDVLRIAYPDLLSGSRTITFVGSQENQSITILVVAGTWMSGQSIPKQVMGYLLQRNATMGHGSWGVQDNINGNVLFRLTYSIPVQKLTPAILRVLCREFAGEVATFEFKLKAVRLL